MSNSLKRYYKLTDSNGKTRGSIQWGENITHHHAWRGEMVLGYDTCIYCYSDPLMASFFLMESCFIAITEDIEEDIKNPRCWEGKVKGEIISDGSIIGCKEFTTIREVPLPEISIEQRVTIAIECALKVYWEPEFNKWASGWLDGTDRSAAAARAASYFAIATVAAHGADAVAAARAANAAEAAYASYSTAFADAADAARAANAAAGRGSNIDILAIIQEVIRKVK